MKDNRIKAIALCRVSTKGQMLEGNLEPQEERIMRAADVLNTEIVKIWKVAISSRKGKNVNRKDLHEMRDYCRHHRSIKFLIVDEVDRFMRSIREYYWWKVEFQNIGVQLRFAKRPDVDPENDQAVFDELIDVYRAESSNNERINKAPSNMKAKMRAGYYPSNPHTGYKKSDIPGLHIPDEPNWSAMQLTFKEMTTGQLTVVEGLKKVTERGLRTKNYGPRAVGGRTIDMNRWKALMKDPYYCGVIKMADWPEINDNGLHERMITPKEHEVLVRLADNKGKKFVVNKENPLFPLSNEMECYDCSRTNARYPRLVGYPHNNGRRRKTFKVYHRYRCRSCNKNVLQAELHDELSRILDSMVMTPIQKDRLKASLRKQWRRYEIGLIEKSKNADGHVVNLKTRKTELILLLSHSPDMEADIRPEIDEIKAKIEEAEIIAENARDFERDFIEFAEFAIEYVDSLREHWWQLDKEAMRKCKQILFPAGFAMTQDKKVYTPEISYVYSYGNNKKAPESADFNIVEGPVGLEPTTPCLKGRCSNRLSYGPLGCG
jgi:DNA invertase Pin-like site-specific DNA recombinase